MPERKRSKLPETAWEQICSLPAEHWLRKVTAELYQQITEVLTPNGVDIIMSSSRTKSLGRMMDKIERRGWGYPLADIHAARFILVKDEIYSAANLILEKWPSPKIYPWGLPSYRDFGNLRTKDRWNKASLPEYAAVHLSIQINKGARLAEVQLMTPEQLQIAEKLRGEYEKRRGY